MRRLCQGEAPQAGIYVCGSDAHLMASGPHLAQGRRVVIPDRLPYEVADRPRLEPTKLMRAPKAAWTAQMGA